MRWLLSVLAVVGLTGVLPLTVPAVAQACSCAFAQDGPQIVEQVSHSAASFTGTATTMRTDGDTAYYEFEVREVFDGNIGATTVVSSSIQSAACGRSFNLGTEYLVFVSRHETKNAPWSVESCSATTESTNTRTRDAAITAFGPPRQPDPQAHPIRLDDVGAPLWQQLAIAAAAIAIVVALVHFGVRAVRNMRTDL